jgi:2-polyprenyl-3-methyl-5-hydroxy-6-metoxy-1,4-benzoquinol methylase
VVALFPTAGTVLDIGCGDAVMSCLLFQHGLHVLGIDIDDTAIELGRAAIRRWLLRAHPFWYFLSYMHGGPLAYLARRGLQLVQASVYDLPRQKSFDFALCQEVIEHLPDPSTAISRVLDAVSSFAIFTTPNGQFCKQGRFDYAVYTPDSFLDLLGRGRAELLHVDEQRIVARLWCG